MRTHRRVISDLLIKRLVNENLAAIISEDIQDFLSCCAFLLTLFASDLWQDEIEASQILSRVRNQQLHSQTESPSTCH